MKKFLGYLIKGVVLLCLIIVAIFFIIDAKAANFLAKKLSEELKVPVTIGDISISLNTIEIKFVVVENLPGSYLKQALSIKNIDCKNNLFNYLDKNISIETIALDNIYLGLEFDSPKGTKGNWTTLMKNLQDSEVPTSKNDTKSIEIKELVLTNIQVDVVYKSSGGSVKKLPPIPKIVLHNISSSQGLPTQEIMQSVLGQMLKSVFVEENLKNMFEGILEEPKSAVDTLLQPFKSLF